MSGLDLGGTLRATALVLFVAFVGGAATLTLYRLGHWAGTDGPNTVGEAGKVYFAARFAKGESLFAGGDEPPYYASTHGALLHASVGFVGRSFGLQTRSLYGVGRTISVVATLFSLLAAGLILGRLGAPRDRLVLVVMLLFASEPIVAHAVSYRADHWNLALSTAACLLLLTARDRTWRLPLLALIPVPAFFLKAPGILLLVPIVLGLLVQGRRRDAAVLTAGSLGLTAGAAALLEWGSRGAFLNGLTGGLAVPVALRHALASAGPPRQWLPWLAGLFALAWVIRSGGDSRRRWLIVGGFFVTALVTGGGTAMRAGSNSYYFVEATLYGSVLAVAGFERARRERSLLAPALLSVAVLTSLLNVPGLAGRLAASVPVDEGTPMDVSVRINRRVAGGRQELIGRIEREGWSCFSDDPGLNVLLDDPQVIYPWLLSQAVESGKVSIEELLDPIRHQEYDVVVLTGIGWSYRGTPNLRPELRRALFESYREVDLGSAYRILRPRNPGDEAGG